MTVDPSQDTSRLVPGSVAPVDALLWPTASLLALWDTLSLELGESAVVTDGHRWSRLAAVVASWYGAFPVVFVSEGTTAPNGALLVRVEDPSEAVRGLQSTLQGRPGVAAVDLSGRADFVDLLLESIPSESGLALAGDGREPLTIDFYVNVHRKGLHMVSSLLDPAPPADGIGVTSTRGASGVSSAHVSRARVLLSDADRTASARDALAGGTPVAESAS